MHPLAEYPRPAMRRDSCEILNGPWQYAITQTAEYPAAWQGSILVPYSPEAPASGVNRTLQPGQWLHYHRLFAPPAGEGGRVLLHFGAVDYACAVQVNGHLAGGHRGGYWPFTLDITDLLNGTGRNSLWVAVQDPTGHGTQARGKQTLKPGGMFYPAQSGIWQTVWLERVPDNYIQTLTVTPDYDARTVTVRVHTAKPGGAVNLWAMVRAGGVTIAEDWGSDEADQDGEVILNIPEEHFFPWSPDTPFLYDLTVGTNQGEEAEFDTVHSYFALRKWSCAPDAHGVLRFCLNDKPILLNGLLDQGYWPEGLYTPPSDAAVERELSEVKALGFNLLRKHAKIEPQRWYYHCDRLGLIVWQDIVNGGSAYNLWFVTYLTNALQPLLRRFPGREGCLQPAEPGKTGRPGGVRPRAGRHGAGAAVPPLHCLLGALQRRVGAVRCRKSRAGPPDAGRHPSGGRGQRLVRPGRGRCALPAQLFLSAAHPPAEAHGGPQRIRRHCLAHARPRAAPQDLRLRHRQRPAGADCPLQEAAAENRAAPAGKRPFGAGVHPAHRCGGRGEWAVHLRPCRRQAGCQRGALGECGTGRRVCKSDKSREKMSKIPGAGNRELHRGFFTGQDFVFCLQMVA